MSRVRLFVLGVLAVCLVSVVATSSASAVVFSLEKVLCNGGTTAFCWENTVTKTLEELKGEQSFEALIDEGTETLLVGLLGGGESHITCTDAHIAGGVLRQPSPLVAVPTGLAIIIFLGCILLEPMALTCEVPTEIKTVDMNITFPNATEIKFEPTEGGTVFVEILYKSVAGKTCLFAGNQEVTGSETCKWATPTVDLTAQLVECLEKTEATTQLLFAKNAALFLLEATVTPEGLGDEWDIVLA